MKAPMVYSADWLLKEGSKTYTELIPGRWFIARPLRMEGFFVWHRIKYAIKVLFGKADVLLWAEDYGRKRMNELRDENEKEYLKECGLESQESGKVIEVDKDTVKRVADEYIDKREKQC